MSDNQFSTAVDNYITTKPHNEYNKDTQPIEQSYDALTNDTSNEYHSASHIAQNSYQEASNEYTQDTQPIRQGYDAVANEASDEWASAEGAVREGYDEVGEVGRDVEGVGEDVEEGVRDQVGDAEEGFEGEKGELEGRAERWMVEDERQG